MENKLKVNNNVLKPESLFNRRILPILCVIAVSAFPAMFMYFQNADEVKFSEMLNPLLIFIFAGLILFGIFLVISKSTIKSAIIASIFMLILINYSLLEKGVQKILPNLRYWHLLAILILILVHIAWLIYKKISNELANTIITVMCVVFCGLIILNCIIAMPTIINRFTFEKRAKEENTNLRQENEKNIELPNIYFLLFDEYSSIDFIEKHYKYDNSAFIQYLEKFGFNVSSTSHNESIITTTITTNLVNLDYIANNLMSESEKESMRINNALFKLLTEKGYTITGIANTKAYGLNNADIDISNSKSTVEGKTISDLLYSRTVFWPFCVNSYTRSERIILSSFEYLKKPENFPQNSGFLMCHMIIPHEPFFFDRNGNVYKSPASNWKDHKYYLGQYIFATNQIIKSIDSIVNNDPNSIIILQSDHSARASSDPELFMEIFPLEDVSSILNTVYFKGEKLDIEGLSGVNTIRLVLNRAFGENFNMLEVPYDTYKYK